MARINPDAEGSSEQLFDTEIPDFGDDANIQEALRMYHYGTADGTFVSTNAGISAGVAGYLKEAFAGISALEAQGIGSSYEAEEPANVVAGHIWVDGSSSGFQSFVTKSVYQTTEPTENLFDGMLWVEKGSSPLTMHVYDADTSTWKAIGA